MALPLLFFQARDIPRALPDSGSFPQGFAWSSTGLLKLRQWSPLLKFLFKVATLTIPNCFQGHSFPVKKNGLHSNWITLRSWSYKTQTVQQPSFIPFHFHPFQFRLEHSCWGSWWGLRFISILTSLSDGQPPIYLVFFSKRAFSFFVMRIGLEFSKSLSSYPSLFSHFTVSSHGETSHFFNTLLRNLLS